MAKRTQTDRIQLYLSINGKEAGKSIKNIRKEYRDLKSTLDELPKGGKEYNKAIKELGKLRGVLDDHNSQIKQAAKGMKANVGVMGIFKKAVRGLGAVLKTAFAPLLALSVVAEIINMATETVRASQEMQKLREEVNRLTGETGDTLNKTTAQIKAISATTEQETANIIQAVNAASNAFGEDFSGSLDLVEKGLIAVGDQGDEFLEQVKEYSVQLKQAGLSNEESLALIASGINAGVYTDKAVDAVKEFNLRIKDLSKGQRDILEQTLGSEFTERIVAGVETGKITSVEALKEVSGQLGELGADSADAQKVISNLFGGPGEDAGADFIISLQNINGSLNDVLDTSNIYVQRQMEQLEAEKQLAEAQAELSFQLDGSGARLKKVGTILRTAFTVGITKVTEFFNYLPFHMRILKVQLANIVNNIIENTLEPLLNSLLDPINALPDLEIPTIKVKETVAEIRNQLKTQISADRAAFAKEQERQDVAAAKRRTQVVNENELQADRNLSRQKAEEAKKRSEEMQKLEEQAQIEIERLRVAVMADGEKKRIAEAKLQAEQKIAQLKGTEAQINEQRELIEQQLQEQLTQIQVEEQQKRAQLLSEQEEKSYQDRLAKLDAGLKANQLKITQQVLADAQELALSPQEMTEQIQSKLLDAELEYLMQKKQLHEELGLETIEIDQQLADMDLENLRSKSEEELAIHQEKWNKIQAIASAATQIIGQLLNLQAQNARQAYDSQIDALEKQKRKELDAFGDSERGKAIIEEKFEKRREKIEEAYRKKQKKNALIQGGIDVASAILKAVASAPFPANLPAIAFATTVGAIQLATIAKQEFADGGIPQGPSHREGGIKMVDSRSGATIGEMEGGEPIISRATYANNREVVDRLLYAGKYQGGSRIFQDGGIVPTSPTEEVVQTVSNDTNLMLVAAIREQTEVIRRKRLVTLVGQSEASMIQDELDDLSSVRSKTNLR